MTRDEIISRIVDDIGAYITGEILKRSNHSLLDQREGLSLVVIARRELEDHITELVTNEERA